MARSTRPIVSQCVTGRKHFITANFKLTQNGKIRQRKTDSKLKNKQKNEFTVLLYVQYNLYLTLIKKNIYIIYASFIHVFM